MEPGNRHLTQVRAGKLGEGLTATRLNYRCWIWKRKEGVTVQRSNRRGFDGE